MVISTLDDRSQTLSVNTVIKKRYVPGPLYYKYFGYWLVESDYHIVDIRCSLSPNTKLLFLPISLSRISSGT
jgi:hypothetical protein